MNKKVDVICQHTIDRRIIPIKVRVEDEYGEMHVFQIESYKTVSRPGTFKMPNEACVMGPYWTFDCKIKIFDSIKQGRLYYHNGDNTWEMSLS